MKIIAYDRFKPGVTMQTIQPLLQREVANVWRLWKAGIVRENYARADEREEDEKNPELSHRRTISVRSRVPKRSRRDQPQTLPSPNHTFVVPERFCIPLCARVPP